MTEKIDAKTKEHAAARKKLPSGYELASLIVAFGAAIGSIWQGYGTRRSVDTQVANSKIERRAWLAVRDANVMRFGVGEPVLVQFHLTNTGLTPAIDAFVAGSAFFLPAQGDPMSVPFNGKGPRSQMLVAPSQVVTALAGTDAPVTQERLRAVALGQSKLYATGSLFYRDTMQSPDRGHQTDFCFYIGNMEWSMSTINADRERHGIIMVGCETGNSVKSDIPWPPAGISRETDRSRQK